MFQGDDRRGRPKGTTDKAKIDHFWLSLEMERARKALCRKGWRFVGMYGLDYESPALTAELQPLFF